MKEQLVLMEYHWTFLLGFFGCQHFCFPIVYFKQLQTGGKRGVTENTRTWSFPKNPKPSQVGLMVEISFRSILQSCCWWFVRNPATTHQLINGIFRDHQGHGTPENGNLPILFPYHSHVRIPKDMGIVWEDYHFRGSHYWGSLESPLSWGWQFNPLFYPTGFITILSVVGDGISEPSTVWHAWMLFGIYLGVSKNRGKTPKWMVKIMENPIKMDDLGVFPLFLETPIYGLNKNWWNIR